MRLNRPTIRLDRLKTSVLSLLRANLVLLVLTPSSLRMATLTTQIICLKLSLFFLLVRTKLLWLKGAYSSPEGKSLWLYRNLPLPPGLRMHGLARLDARRMPQLKKETKTSRNPGASCQ